jgi:HEAT repeat protein
LNVLQLLWWSSLLLAGLALLWLLGLICVRLVREGADARRRTARQAIRRVYLAVMTGAGEPEDLLKPYQTRSRLLAETLLELQGLVRGAERERLIEALRRAGVEQQLRSRLTRGSRIGRLAAVEALSAFPSDAVCSDLWALHCRSENAELRVATLRTLIAIGARPRIQDLIYYLQTEAEGASLQYAPVLRQLTLEDPEDALNALALAGLPVAAQAITIEALGASGHDRAMPVLCEMSKARDPVLRMAAVRALGSLAHPGVKSAVGAALSDDAWEVRAEAATAASLIGGKDLIKSLVIQLEDPVWWVRLRAADALTRLGAGGLEALRAAVSSPLEATRRSASLALAGFGQT